MRRASFILFAVLLAFGLALGVAPWRAHQKAEMGAREAVTTRHAEIEARNRDIEFYEARVRRDPRSWLNLAQLAGLYLQRARETGSHDDLHRAEVAARGSLEESQMRNGKSAVTLASALLGQHRFEEAYEVAKDLCTLDPDTPSYQSLLGEIQMELGRYDEARATFETLRRAPAELSVAPRLARWEEMEGRPEEALRLLSAARDAAVVRPDLPREQVAWFWLRIGDVQSRRGDLRAAEVAYRLGIDVEPEDHRLLAAMARLAAGRGDWKKARELAQRAVALVPDVPATILLREACAALGDTAKAAVYDRSIDQRATNEHQSFNRPWMLFLLDHDRRVPETLAQLRDEIRTRPDVYGYDLLAWALHKNGDDAAARQAMTQGLRLGTRDPQLYFHAGIIEAALGARDEARQYLQQALDISPQFHYRDAALARATLKALEKSTSAHLEADAVLWRR